MLRRSFLAVAVALTGLSLPAQTAPPVPPPVVAVTGDAATSREPGRGGPAAVTVEVAGPARLAPGEALTATVRVRNVGGAVAAQVRVEVPLPAGTKLVSAEPAAVARGDRLTWALGNLDAGAERLLR